ncbi:S8 family serine peptidase [Pseudidiomarina sediminum]|uniref:S8 family serine peptidase n=1 Tax=Pseudidiomarina sediminum TaxID=431675 RepID=UPI001C956E45|nr:S8 family serine peptidase [Pseudidiomarina sediminum]MBY6063621.1 S8 family serine peptidase [Pseudidiomarina sediminum]
MTTPRLNLRPAVVALAVASTLTPALAQQFHRVDVPAPQPMHLHQLEKNAQQADLQVVRKYDVTRFIVELEAPAVATYKGGIAGFTPTAPVATGATRLQATAPAVQSYQQHLLSKQEQVMRGLKAQVSGLEVKHQLTLTFNGMVVELQGKREDTQMLRAQLAQVPGVKRVYEDEKYYASTGASTELINAGPVWQLLGGQEQAGRGVKVAIIDGGIDHDHPLFDGTGYPATSRPTKPDYCTTEPTFCNDKLIVARWYPPVGEVHPEETETPADHNGHGTHVAGTAVGLPGSVTTNSGTTLNMTGVAPGAYLMVYKALFSNAEGRGEGASSQLLPAIEDAVADGADIINNSWGGGPGGHPSDSPYAAAFAAARAAGVLTVTAAGNDGPGDRTVGCPGCIEDGLTVANTKYGRGYYPAVKVLGENEVTARVASGGFTLNAAINGDLMLAEEEGDKLACLPFAPNTFTGAVVLVQRGECNFSQKAFNVQAAGAAGMIVYNNVEAPLLMSIGEETLPTVSLPLSAGEAIANGWNSADDVSLLPADFRIDTADVDVLEASSSRGPNGDSTFLKPDIAAPGTYILAPVPDDSADFLTGTSMASPHVAGAAALLKDQRPSLNADQLKSILMTSADAGVRGDDALTPSTPFERGAGRLNVDKAAKTYVVVDTPSLVDNACVVSCTFTRTFTNIGDNDYSFTVATQFDDSGLTADVDTSTFTLASQQSVTVTFEVASSFADEGWNFGEVLVSSGSHPELRLPVAISAKMSDNAAIATIAQTGGEVALNSPFSVSARGALGSTGAPVTMQVQVPAGAKVVADDVTFTEVRATATDKGVNSAGTLVTWEGQQTDEANVASIAPVTASPFAGLTIADLIGSSGNEVCADGCDDAIFSLQIGDLGGIYVDGTRYDAITISSNGIIGAGDNAAAFATSANNMMIPSDAPPNAFWAPFWTDLEMGVNAGGGQINFAAFGTETTTYLAVEFESVRRWNDTSGDRYSFSIIFEMGTSNVYFNYIDLPTQAPGRLTIGAESGADALGVIGAQRYFNSIGSYPTSGTVLQPKLMRGERASVEMAFDLVVDTIADAPDIDLSIGLDTSVTVDPSDNLSHLGRDLLSLLTVTSGDQSYNAVLANSIASEGELTLEIVSGPSNGTAEVIDGKKLKYTPDSGFVGDDSFTYRGVDGAGQPTTTAEVAIEVAANNPPNASISAPLQRVPSGQMVTLSAAPSGDPDGDVLAYSWTQTAGPSVELSAPGEETTSFNAPQVSSEQVLTFELTVTDGALEDKASIDITVYPRESGGDDDDDTEGSFGAWLGLLALPFVLFRRRVRQQK